MVRFKVVHLGEDGDVQGLSVVDAASVPDGARQAADALVFHGPKRSVRSLWTGSASVSAAPFGEGLGAGGIRSRRAR